MTRNAKQKQIVVIGLGQFGGQIARDLSKHAQVLAIDLEMDKVDAVADSVQRALCLDASKLGPLQSVISKDFDEAIVSMGETMEASTLCTLHLKQIGVKSIRAKAISEDHAMILKSVGATDVVYPERETASRMAQTILNPNLLDFIPIDKEYQVTDLAAPETFHGKSLIELELRKRYGVFVIAVKHQNEDSFQFLPSPDYSIQATDILVLIGKEDDILRIGTDGKADESD